MSTLCYRLNLVVSLDDVAHGRPVCERSAICRWHCGKRYALCDPVSSVDVNDHIVPRMPRVERAITLPVHQCL